jgi:hypothetical protein
MVCLQTMKARALRLPAVLSAWVLLVLAASGYGCVALLYRGMFEFGLSMGLGKASWVVWSCRLSGRPVVNAVGRLRCSLEM